MSSPKLLLLLSRLNALTTKSRVDWKEAETQDSFMASFVEHSVRLQKGRSRKHPGQTEYILSIQNEFGDTVEEMGDEDADDAGETYMQMKELFDSARRKALGVDKALDSILSQLDEVDDTPF